MQFIETKHLKEYKSSKPWFYVDRAVEPKEKRKINQDAI